MNPEDIASIYDSAFDGIPNLIWRPWVGQRYHRDKPVSRVLIVGESHYARREDGKTVEESIGAQMQKRDYTRQVIWECPVKKLWSNPTLSRIAPIIVGRGNYDRESLWADLSFFNLVQRSMKAPPKTDRLPGEATERPNGSDFEHGWTMFPAIAQALSPDICLCLGTAARPYFAPAMQRAGSSYEEEKKEQVGRCAGYSGTLTLNTKAIRIIFVQHPNRFFPTTKWHEFLRREYPAIETLSIHRR